MVYRSYSDMADAVRRNLWKIPQDTGLVVGVPRSGMIPALMIAELLGRPCASLDAFLKGDVMSCGDRKALIAGGRDDRVLVVDDTVNTGVSMARARASLASLAGRFSITYACVYARGEFARGMVDVWLEDIFAPGERWYMYEWNVLHHHAHRTAAMMWDIDGVMCQDPPSERDEQAYASYLPRAVPMVLPTTRVGAVVTYRLERYRAETESWLRAHGVDYGDLVMFRAATREERAATSYPGRYKAHVYLKSRWAMLFVESSREQAVRIAQLSGKPVFCYEDGRLYDGTGKDDGAGSCP